MSPEFHGIHLLYLDSKIVALKGISAILLFLAVAVSTHAFSQERSILQMRYDMEEGNNVRCEEGYIAKVVEGTRVSCIMKRVAPGDLTYKVVLKKGAK